MDPRLRRGLGRFLLEADDGSGGTGGSTGTPPAEEMVEMKDPVTGNSVKVSKSVSVLIGHQITAGRKAADEKYKPIIDKLESDSEGNKGIKDELDKLKFDSLTAEEQIKSSTAKAIKEAEDKANGASLEIDVWKNRFQSTMVTNDIYGSFGDIKLSNPEQVGMLLQMEGRPEVTEIQDDSGKPTGRFETSLTLQLLNPTTGNMEAVKGSPKELFKRWIDEDRNLFHQLNNLASGGGTTSGGKGRTAGTNYEGMSPAQKLTAAREQNQ